MKKILFLFPFLFIVYTSFSQVIVERSRPTITVEDARLSSRINFYLPRYYDTTAANLQIGLDSCSAVIFTYNTNTAWLRECSPKRWVLLGSGSGGASVTQADTLFVADDLYVSFDEEGRQVLRSSKVTTVADLRNITNPQTGLIYMSTDMGGGIWLWNDTAMTADNTGTFLKLNGIDTGRLERQYDGALNCLWFDIKGDSVTDNSTPFISMFASMGEGHSYYLPPGLYMISNETMGDIIIPSYTHFFGAGIGISIIKLFDNVSPGVTATVNMMITADDGTNITIEGFTLDGNRQNQSWLPLGSANYGLAIRSYNTTVLNVECKNVTANGCGMGNDGPANVIFDKVWSHDNGKKGFHAGEVSNIKIVNGFYYNNEEDAGIGIHAGMTKILIDNNHCYHNRTGIQVGRSVNRPVTGNAIVSNNFIDSNEVNGISIGQSFDLGSSIDSLDKNITVIGNHLYKDRIQLTNASNVILTGNILTQSFFQIESSHNLSIRNNEIILDSNYRVGAIHVAGGGFGMDSIQYCSNINIENNTITVGPDVDYGITVAITRNLTLRDNTVRGTAAIYNYRVWDNIGTAIIKQTGNGTVRIESQTFATGYDNTIVTVSATEPEHGYVGQKYFLTPTYQLKVCSVASTYDANGDLLVAATWVVPILDASETSKGLVERATQPETDAGVDNEKFITPYRLENYNDGITGTKYITGSEDATGLLRLQSTKNATKGRVEFGLTGNSWYNDATFNWGLGVGSTGTPVTTERVTIANSSTGALMTGMRLENRFSTAGTGMRLAWGVAGSQTVTGAIDNIFDVSNERHMPFFTYTGSALTEKMRITGKGPIGIGTTAPDSTAALHISSTTRGLLIPRHTTAQRDAVVTPATGLLIYNTTLDSFQYRNTSAWVTLGSGGGGSQTLQQVLTEGSILTTTNIIDKGTTDLTFTGAGSTPTIYFDNTGTGAAAYLQVTPAAVNTIVPVLTLNRSATAGAEAGIGGSIDNYIETSTSNRVASRFVTTWTNHVDANRTTNILLKGIDNAVEETFMDIQKDLVRINNNADTVATLQDVRDGGGSGETNTASNLGGGLANYSTKVGVDLQFNSFAAADFDLGSNLISIDATKWAPLASPAFTGVPAAPTAAAATNTTQLATTAFVFAERSNTFSLTNKTIDGDLNTLLDIPASAIKTSDTETFDPSLYALLVTPTFTTNITTPLIIGGTATTSSLTYKTTTGVGATGADHIFKVGSNGSIEAMRILNNGNVGIAVVSPVEKLEVAGNILVRSGNILQVNSSDNLGSAQVFADGSYNSILRSGGNNVNLQAAGGIGFQTYTASTYNDKVTISNAGVLGITVVPTTSAGTYDFLSRNTSTGLVEKVTSASVATPTGTQTLTNKRWTARVGSTTSSATPTINTDNYDIYKLTAQAEAITSFSSNLSGTPVDGDILEIQITGTAARALTFGASFVSSTVTIPTTTVTTATLTVIFQYFTTSSYGNNKWVCVNSF